MIPIHEKSIFGGYKRLEDQATAALLHILDMGGPHMVEYVFEDSLSSGNFDGYIISSQTDHGTSRPDGEILADYHLLIESKIDEWRVNDHNMKQLTNHLNNAKKSNAILVYILNQTDIPNIIQANGCLSTTWDDVIKRLKEFNTQRAYFNKELMNYLIDQLKLLIKCNPIKSPSWKTIPRNQRVVIVGGSWGEDVALNYGFYACQYNRNFQSPSYIAFYHKKRIKYVFKIINHGYFENINQATDRFRFEFKDYFQSKEPTYASKAKEEQRRQFFVLEKVEDFHSEIAHEETYAYVQKQRYTSIEALKQAKTTKDL